MKNISLQLFVFFLFPLSSVTSQITLIPDASFEQQLINLGYDIAPIDGSVPTANISSVTSLTVNVLPFVSDLTGIEDFSSLTYLDCSFNQVTFLDLSQNTALVQLICWGNLLSSLDLSQNTMLERLDCFGNQILNLDVSQNPRLTDLTCSNNQITSLDLANDTSLVYLSCFGNLLDTLNVSQNTKLTEIYCDGNQLSVLDLSQNIMLSKLVCLSNLITELYLANNPLLSSLNCSSNPQLTCLNIRNTNLTTINTINTALTCIEVDTVASAPDIALSTVDIGSASYSVDCGNSCSSVGIYENYLTPPHVYPNPAQDKITVELGGDSFRYQIIGLSGEVIRPMITNFTSTIDVSNLLDGFYILQILQGNKEKSIPLIIFK